MLINRRLSKDTSNLLVKLLKNLKRIWNNEDGIVGLSSGPKIRC